jgi:ssDNA-binding Zn-finger/Zn-ribbon topoisomerase 1
MTCEKCHKIVKQLYSKKGVQPMCEKCFYSQEDGA